jgi:hypothetical protein
MVMVDMACEQLRCKQEATAQRSGPMELPSRGSAAMLMSDWIGAVEVGILAAHEATVLVV